MKPSIGRIVHYTLSEGDAEQINRRRTTGRAIADRLETGAWPLGAQAHIGNHAEAGQVYPLLITRVWPSDTGAVNGQVFLDGNDVFWATSRTQANYPGMPEADAPEGGRIAAGTEDARGKWQWPTREAA